MDAVERKVVRFSLPPLAPPFYNGHALWPEANRSLHVTNTSTLKVIPYKRPSLVRKGCGQSKSVPAATIAHSGRHDQSDKNAAARADDDELPSLEELSPNTSTKASKTEPTLQQLKQPALDAAGMLHIDQTKSGLGERQGGSLDQQMIFDDAMDQAGAADEAEDASGDINIGRIGRDRSPHNTLASSELASGPAKSIDTSGPWYDIEEDRWIDDPAPSEGNDLEKDFEFAPAEYEKSLSTISLISSRPSRRSTEPSQAQIVQEDEQSGTTRGRLDELGRGTLLREQDDCVMEQQERQRQQEAAVEATGEDGSHGSSASGCDDEPIIFDGENRPNDGSENVDAEPSRRTVGSGQLSDNVRNLETILTLGDGTANERDNDHGVSNGEHIVTAKRRRSISPRSTVYHLGTSPLPYSEDAKRHREYIDCSDPDDSGDDDVRSKRRRLSAPLGGRAMLNQHKKRSPRFPSPILEDELDGTRIISADCKPVSTPTTTSAASESAVPIEPQLVTQVIDDDQQWDVRRIIGKEDVDGVLHYWVAWCETLEPEHSLGHAKELVDEFEARLLAKREVKDGPKKPGLKRREHAVVGDDAYAQQQKRRRGRPRKQP